VAQTKSSSQIRKSYRNEPQNTTTHCTHCLTVSESGEPKIWTIVQIFGLAKKRALKFPYLGSALQSFKKKSVRRSDIYRGLAAGF
jgi:hypothetical protein